MAKRPTRIIITLSEKQLKLLHEIAGEYFNDNRMDAVYFAIQLLFHFYNKSDFVRKVVSGYHKMRRLKETLRLMGGKVPADLKQGKNRVGAPRKYLREGESLDSVDSVE